MTCSSVAQHWETPVLDSIHTAVALCLLHFYAAFTDKKRQACHQLTRFGQHMLHYQTTSKEHTYGDNATINLFRLSFAQKILHY
jgi:hypothetical protein